MRDSSRVFTVILVIIIAFVVGLIIFLTFSILNTFNISDLNAKIATEFENSVEDKQIIYKNEEDSSNSNKISIDTSLVDIPSSDPDEGESSSGEGSSRRVVKYNGYTVVGTIEIPSTKIKYPILQDLSKSSIENGIAVMYTTTPNNELNKPGNVVLAGHNYRDGTFFSNNKKLEEGDKIYITDNDGNKVTYIVYNTYVTTPEDFDYATRPTEGRREISLTTCTDDVKSRLIIWASAD